MFRDLVKIRVQAGDGGRGCISFRREKYVPLGGPNGGDGGDGGSVHLVCGRSYTNLGHLRERQLFKAKNGSHGKGSNKHGKKGSDCEIFVPPGTMVCDVETGEELGDLAGQEERVLVAAGGFGGRGNTRFKSSTERAPRRADPGCPGERRALQLELKLVADVGLVGRPNAGKTTLLGCLTGSKGKVAPYPFTTLEPNLGILQLSGYRRAVLADVPGLIEGAHRGEGLGLNFLRHIERTGALAMLVEIMPPEGDVVDHYETLCSELHHYNETLLGRPRMVVATKTDLSPPAKTIEALRFAAESDGASFCTISSISGVGLADFVNWVGEQTPTDGRDTL
jgi:GTP-binding protein